MRNKCRFFRYSAVIMLIFLSAVSSVAEVVYIEDTGFVLEPPVGWTILDVSESRWTFQDFTGEAFMQIKMYPGDKYDSAGAVFNGVTAEINAEAEGDIYDLYGREAVFGFLEFNSGGYDYSGYGLFIDGDDFDLTILSFSSTEASELLRDYVLSALDSFALSPVLMLNPGPVSSYYLQSFGEPQRQQTATVFEDQAVDWLVDANAVETSQLVIEREAAILSDFRPDSDEGIEAWKRYYRIIYRDNYSRLDYPAALLKERLSEVSSSSRGSAGNAGDTDAADDDSWFSARLTPRELAADTPHRLLSWVQKFNYRRTGGSDLISPLAAAAFQDGDCDSRALLYIILLNHYGVDSAIMVSAVYSHAMAAVDTAGQGARIDVGGKGFLVAETTDEVGLGMIASDMADPAKWVVIPLMEKEPWN
ncbi:MAG TPA: hypothetical protein DCO79_07105 [Spirochaeta sp.]|nr:hypothetical protein [Spirochaeta sp.]